MQNLVVRSAGGEGTPASLSLWPMSIDARSEIWMCPLCLGSLKRTYHRNPPQLAPQLVPNSGTARCRESSGHLRPGALDRLSRGQPRDIEQLP
jgi:hypothetical protein